MHELLLDRYEFKNENGKQLLSQAITNLYFVNCEGKVGKIRLKDMFDYNYGNNVSENFLIQRAGRFLADSKNHGEQFNEEFVLHMNATIETEKQMKNKPQKNR